MLRYCCFNIPNIINSQTFQTDWRIKNICFKFTWISLKYRWCEFKCTKSQTTPCHKLVSNQVVKNTTSTSKGVILNVNYWHYSIILSKFLLMSISSPLSSLTSYNNSLNWFLTSNRLYCLYMLFAGSYNV